MGAESTAPATSPAKLLKGLVGPVYLPIIGASISWGMMVPVLPLYLTAEGFSLGLAGVVLGATGIGAAVGSLPAGAAMARVSENATMVVAIVATAVATALLGLVAGALALIVLQSVIGASRTAMRLSRQTYVTRRVPAGTRGRALSLVGGSTRVALLIGPLLGGLLVDQFGFNAAFVVAALFAVAALVPLLRTPPQTELIGRSRSPLSPSRSEGLLRSLHRHRRLLAQVAVVPFLVVAAREGRQVAIPLIGDDLALSATAVGALVAVSAFADVLLFPVSGLLMDRFGRLWGMVPSFILMGLGHVGLGLAWSSGSLVVVVAASVLIGVGNGLGAGSMLTLGSDVAPADSAPEFLAGLATLQDSGRILGPMVVGFVAAGVSLGAAAATIGVLLFAAAAWLILVIGETRIV